MPLWVFSIPPENQGSVFRLINLSVIQFNIYIKATYVNLNWLSIYTDFFKKGIILESKETKKNIQPQGCYSVFFKQKRQIITDVYNSYTCQVKII